MADLRHHTTDLGEVELHWAEVGEGPPLVLVHGLIDSHRTWRHVWPRIRGRRLLMVDLPGHGLSGRPDAPYTPEWNASQLMRWFDQLGLDRFDIAGHSYGGGLIQYLILKCPERLNRMALVCPGGLGRDVELGLRLAALAPHVVQLFGRRGLGPLIQSTLSRETRSDAREELRIITDSLGVPGGARAFARTVRAVIGLRGQRRTYRDHADEARDLPAMRLFWGIHDRIVPFEHGASFVTLVDDCELVRFNCGHFVHWDDPAGFVAELERFLNARALPVTRKRGPGRGAARLAANL